MAIDTTQVYIDTSVSGLVNLVNHGFNGTPDVFITEVVGSSEVYVPLMDARIAEIKNLDIDNFQITFASAFQGFIYLRFMKADTPTDKSRLLKLEADYVQHLALIRTKVSFAKWKALDALRDQQMTGLQNQITDLTSRVAKNEADISLL